MAAARKSWLRTLKTHGRGPMPCDCSRSRFDRRSHYNISYIDIVSIAAAIGLRSFPVYVPTEDSQRGFHLRRTASSNPHCSRAGESHRCRTLEPVPIRRPRSAPEGWSICKDRAAALEPIRSVGRNLWSGRRRFQSRRMREATMKQPPAASIESTVIVIARGLGSPSFAAARDHWSMIRPNVPTYICTSR
jgi:hypothetical protein